MFFLYRILLLPNELETCGQAEMEVTGKADLAMRHDVDRPPGGNIAE